MAFVALAMSLTTNFKAMACRSSGTNTLSVKMLRTYKLRRWTPRHIPKKHGFCQVSLPEKPTRNSIQF